MKRHLNTLFVTTQGAYLAKQGDTVLVRVEGETKLQVPIHTIGGIVCFGQVSCSPFLMGLCGEHDVALSFLTERGRFLARVQGPTTGNVLLRREQYRRADAPAGSAHVAAAVVAGKIANCRTVLQRALRDHPETPGAPGIRQAAHRLAAILRGCTGAVPLDRIRGMEGDAGRTYFSVFGEMVTSQKEDFPFPGRSRRPPQDNLNALLSFLYTVLMHDVRSALETVGLDPAVGFLHRDRPGRASLALDLMEELRPILADRLVLSLVNLRQVSGKGFTRGETGGVLMNDATRKTVLVAYQERKKDELEHPFAGERVTIGLLPHIQARLLARHIRGDLDGYPPFIWK
ncbi:MAG: type I-C CRISPR-associated endonuclease Cas1 [Planctomycetes bacterium]|nr:type I-C CRISPR-associated endonuclease Cas1 [Planctomycetota bacterium]